jgi:uncharacterized protein YutE (UPF0331/DUF86 family)
MDKGKDRTRQEIMTRQKALVFLSEVEKELSLIDRAVEVIEKRLRALKSKTDTEDFSAYTESLAINIHGFYEGIETIFEKVTDFTGEEKPSGPEWHMELLERMTLPIKRLRPDVISVETAKRLDTYRAFRHKVRHIYGFMIVPENIITLAEKIKEAYKGFKRDLRRFIAFAEEVAEISS